MSRVQIPSPALLAQHRPLSSRAAPHDIISGPYFRGVWPIGNRGNARNQGNPVFLLPMTPPEPAFDGENIRKSTSTLNWSDICFTLFNAVAETPPEKCGSQPINELDRINIRRSRLGKRRLMHSLRAGADQVIKVARVQTFHKKKEVIFLH